MGGVGKGASLKISAHAPNMSQFSDSQTQQLWNELVAPMENVELNRTHKSISSMETSVSVHESVSQSCATGCMGIPP